MEKIILKLLIIKEAIVLFFVLLLAILITIIINSKIQIEIYNLDISTERKEKIKKDFKIYIKIVIFEKIKILKIDVKKITNKKININKLIEKAKKIEKNNLNKQLTKDALKNLKELQIEVKNADLKLELGTEEASTTAILVGIISTIIGIILKRQKFKIIPIYENKNILNIKLNCIIRINLIHYIYKMIKKGRKRNEGKSSDRRPYAYNHE